MQMNTTTRFCLTCLLLLGAFVGFRPSFAQQKRLLICCPEQLQPELSDFVLWKQQRGFEVLVSAVPEDFSELSFDYLLLIGNAQSLPPLSQPSKDPLQDYVISSDLQLLVDVYADSLPHIPAIGRLAVDSPEELQQCLQRSIDYEQHNNFALPSALLLTSSTPADEQQREVLEQLLTSANATIVSLPSTTTPDQVATHLNTGCHLLLYAGDGTPYAWNTSGFSAAHIPLLQNAQSPLPIVFSAACYNGNLLQDYCFAQVWTTASNNTASVGATAVVMATAPVAEQPPLYLQARFVENYLNAMSNPALLLGDVYANALAALLQEDASLPARETAAAFILFGDPTLQLHQPTSHIVPIEAAHRVQPYPNPTSGMLYLRQKPAEEPAILYTLYGQELLRTNNNCIDLTPFPAGMYLLRIGKQTQRLIRR